MARKAKKGNRYRVNPEKARARRRQGLFVAAVCCGFLAVLLASATAFILVHDLFTQTDYFAAERINVEGTRVLATWEVLECAGVKPGMNILSVSLGKVRERLLANPWIRSAQVRRDLPDGFTIVVEERQPVAVVDLGEPFLMDGEGAVFKRYEAGDPVRVPVVSGLRAQDVGAVGQEASGPARAVVEMLASYREAARPGGVVLTRVDVDRELGISVVTDAPQVAVHLGYGRYPEKLERLHYVLYNLNRREGIRAASIDLSDVDRVVVRPDGEEQAGILESHKEV